MPKFASTGLLAFTGGLAGAGTGLSNAAQQYAKHVADKDIESLRNEYDIKKVQLADQLGGIRAKERMAFDAEQNALNRNQEIKVVDKKEAGATERVDMSQQGEGARTQWKIKSDITEGRADRSSKENMFGQELALRKEMADNQLALGREQIAASKDASQLQAGVQVTLQGMQNSNMTDRQITEHIQRDKEQGVKGAQEMAVLHEQAAESRRNLQAEYNLKTLMTRQEFLNALDLAKENNKAAMDRTVVGEEGATGRAQLAADTSRANALTAADTEIETTGMRTDSAELIKKMDQGEVHDFLVDQSGEVYSVDKLGKASKTPIMNAQGKPIHMPADKGKQDKVLVGALLKSLNDIQERINRGDAEDPEGLEDLRRQREGLFQRLTGVTIRDAKNYDVGDLSQPAGATQPGEHAPRAEASGSTLGAAMRGALPGQLGGLLNSLRSNKPASKPTGLLNIPDSEDPEEEVTTRPRQLVIPGAQ